MVDSKPIPPRTRKVAASTEALRAAVQPESLEDVLASLKFRRVILDFTVSTTMTVILMGTAVGMSLVELISHKPLE